MSTLDLIQVRRYGTTGPTVVVLHGGPGAPGSAAGLAQALAEWFAVLEPLQRRSGKVALTVAQHVEDLAEVAPTPAILVGCSWGAMLGLSYAARYPERVSDLALIGCGTYDEASRALLHQSLQQHLTQSELRRVRDLQERLAMTLDPAVRDALLREVGSVVISAESYDPIDDIDATQDLLPTDATGHAETWQDVLRLQREGIEPRAFDAITARVLLLHGSSDLHPGVETRDLLRRHLPRLEYISLDRCGHEPWRERHAREPFLQALRAWIVQGTEPRGDRDRDGRSGI